MDSYQRQAGFTARVLLLDQDFLLKVQATCKDEKYATLSQFLCEGHNCICPI